MCNRLLFALAPQNASSTTSDVHSLEELLLAVHTLELHVNVPGHGWIVLLVRVSFLKDVLGLQLQVFDLLLRLLYLRVHILTLVLLSVVLAERLVKLFLLDQEFAHLLHVLQVAHIG